MKIFKRMKEGILRKARERCERMTPYNRKGKAVQDAITVLGTWIFCSTKTGGPESSTSSTSSTKRK